MANTPNLQLENINILADTEYAYNQIVSEIIGKTNSNLSILDGLIPSTQKGQADGIATLDINSRIPINQIPYESRGVERVTNIANRDLLTNLYNNKIVFVDDATADVTVTNGWALYIYNSSTLVWTKITSLDSLDITWNNIKYKPTAFPPDEHTHSQMSINLNLIKESTGYGIINGLQVTEQVIPDMTVNVSGGVIHTQEGSRFDINQTNITITASDINNPRIDVVYVSSSGIASYLEGTTSSSPIAPMIPNGLLLAEIYVGMNVTAITNANIKDRRILKVDMSNQAKDITNNKKYRYGLQIVNGQPQFIYEEIL